MTRGRTSTDGQPDRALSATAVSTDATRMLLRIVKNEKKLTIRPATEIGSSRMIIR